MSPQPSKTGAPSGPLAVGRISTRPSPAVARCSSHRSTGSVHGWNSPEPSSATSGRATFLPGGLAASLLLKRRGGGRGGRAGRGRGTGGCHRGTGRPFRDTQAHAREHGIRRGEHVAVGL